MSTPVGDERGRDGRADGHGRPADPGPITVEQLIARSGNASGRRAARRTGEVPIPLGPGESLPAHRGPLPPVPGERPTPSSLHSGAAPHGDAAPRRGLPPVPGGSPRPEPPAPPAVPPVAGPVHRSQPVPPLPGGVRYSAPVPPLPGGPGGVRYSAPVPPLPGGRPGAPLPQHRSVPVPPIPGLDAPAMSGAGSTRRPALDRRAARRAARSPGRRRLVRAALALAALVGLVVAYHLGLYVHVDRDIARVAALAPDGPEVIAPTLQEGATTYLVVGTGLPGATGPASVTTLLVHVASGGDRAVLVSVPPTALVDTPGCRTADGGERDPVSEAFAASLLAGGPACTVRAVQQLTGLRVDHYLAVDLGRLPSMVDAIGGVSVCLPTTTEAVAASARPLPAGTSELTGAQAGQYLAPGDAGSDVTGAAAAERAQLLLSATLRSAMTVGTLSRPWELASFLTRAADALTVDQQTTLGDLRTLAGALGDLEADAVQRAALPVAQVGYVPAGSDQAHVLLDGAGVRTLFDTVIEDSAVPAELAATAVAAATAAADAPAVDPAAATGAEQPAAAPAAQPLTVAPSGTTVDVLNGTATAGLAATVADQLRQQGFVVGEVGNERGVVNQTVVRHGPGVLEQARTAAAAVPGAVLQPSDAIGDSVQLVLGPGFSGVVPVQVAAPAPPAAATPAADTPAAGTAPAASAAPVSCS
ncbi:LCP family protein required for cell wall assembly [Geodermatophilus bullaregiensis]|uniref:LCP family protein n=1 Tax=Geodermatophilus bullaregiensis TaxID=1564160 RepID=UPI001957CE8F|nr:LCP family protein [Geodermatophilus bullaregiensis]MBM7806133.1 LCP family protein required for cell wall assembly [Geodermatophilus bullaregiensis]